MKLMLKISIIFLSVLGLLFYFLHDKVPEAATAPEAMVKLASLPKQVKESSGIQVLPQQGQYLTHNDAGNAPHLYQINEQGQLVKTFKMKLQNVDWEDLTSDNKGNLYIADTGNNKNKRKELAIYKTSISAPSEAEAIRFTYEDQEKFPPAKQDRNFDCEAIFWHKGSLYLISKDRGRKETAKVYQLPDQPGRYAAKLVGSHKLDAQVTGAAISPDANTVALVSVEKLHLFRNVSDPAMYYKGSYEEVALPGAGQTEAVTFVDNNTLVLSSEGGNLYRYSLN